MKITPLGDSAVTISFSELKPREAGELLPTVWALRDSNR